METGVNAVGLDHSVDPLWANKYLPKGMPVQGNLDPLSLIFADKNMLQNIDQILEAFREGLTSLI